MRADACDSRASTSRTSTDPEHPRTAGADSSRRCRRCRGRAAPAARERGTTPNGVFGAKMMWAYLGDFREHGEPEEQLLADAPGPAVVHVERRDTLAQAISLWRALQTRAVARRGPRRRGEPVFHAGAIVHLKHRLEVHAAAWRGWFAERGIEPLEIVYEEFAADPAADDLRGARPRRRAERGRDVPEPPMRRQADARSQEWVDRFRTRSPHERRRPSRLSQLRALEAEAVHIMRSARSRRYSSAITRRSGTSTASTEPATAACHWLVQSRAWRGRACGGPPGARRPSRRRRPSVEHPTDRDARGPSRRGSGSR